MYFDLALKILLCSTELYRDQLQNIAVSIILLAFILIFEAFIVLFRMNTPNIFNSLIHDYTLFLEAFILSLTSIVMIALITQRDIITTLAYLCIFIPVLIKIFYTMDQSRKNLVLLKLKNEENLSDNEYLIAINYLLKMIKRQSETDIAQLLSFTYYHKLYCYDTGCICQFFTQYCQEPLKFKLKKRRTYRGYHDDGMKLIQMQAGNDGEMIIEQNDDSLQLSPSATNPQTQIPIVQSLSNTRQHASSTVQVNNHIQKKVSHDHQANRHESALTALNAEGSSDVMRLSQNQEESQLDYSNASNLEFNNNQMHGEQEFAGDNITVNGGLNLFGSIEYKEKGIKAQFIKNQILKGEAFNGFDRNLDFKIKGEFKSPAQFKTIYESRTYFFTRMLETMFKQLEQRTNKNASFVLISIYFNFAYQHNIYMAALNLVKISKTLNNSTFAKMAFSVTEYHLLEMIMNDFKRQTKDEIDYNSFIESSQIQQKLDWLFEDASIEIILFWRLFKEEQANVKKAYHLAMNISRNITLIRNYTILLEEQKLIKDYNKYYYYALFYQNLLSDRASYNQMIGNIRNLMMIKNLQRKNNRFGGTTMDINDIGFAIFQIEENGPLDKNIARFTYCNRALQQILCVSEEEVLGKSVTLMMPESTRMNHDLFVKRFFSDGLNRLIGKTRNLYIKDFNGYIKPVQFFLNFYYTSKFSYSIIMHIDPILQLQYHGSSSLINIKNCMIFLCEENNIVSNISENVKKIIGLSKSKMKEEEELLGRQLRIEDIVKDFYRIEQNIASNHLDFLPNQQVKVRNYRFKNTTVSGQPTNEYKLNTNFDPAYLNCMLSYEENVYLKDFPGQFTERIYMLIPFSKVPEADNANMGSQGVSINQHLLPSAHDLSNQIDISNSKSSTNDGNATPSVSSMGSSSSAVSSNGVATTKNLLFQQKSPKILNLYLTIVFLVFASFIIITSINYIFYFAKKNQVEQQIQYNDLINQRNIYLVSTILDIKVLQLIGDKKSRLNSNTNISNIFLPPWDVNRFGKYNDLMIQDQIKFKTNQDNLKSMGLRDPSLMTNLDSGLSPEIEYLFISDKGIPYYQNQTLEFGIQTLISNIAMITQDAILQEAIQMNLNAYLASYNYSTMPKISQLFKNLHFIYSNGMGQINDVIRKENDNLLQNTIDVSDSSNLFLSLISFISIGMITFIGISTFPMLGKIEDRKISVLKFFTTLSVEQINNLILKGEEYREEFQDMTNKQNHQKADKFETNEQDQDELSPRGAGGMKEILPGNQIQFSGARSVSKNMNNIKAIKANRKKSKKSSKESKLSQNQIKMYKGSKDSQKPLGKGKKVYFNEKGGLASAFEEDDGTPKNGRKDKYKIEEENKESDNDGQYNNNNYYSNSDKKKKKGALKQDDDVVEIAIEDDSDESSGDDGQKKKKKQNKKLNKHDQSKDGTQGMESHQINRIDHINEQLEKVALKEKIKLAFLVFFTLIFLNSCIISCFFVGKKTFTEDANAVFSMKTLYRRQFCFENLMLYTVEQLIQNNTVSINATKNDAVQIYIDYCQTHEQDYNIMRQNFPVYMQQASQTMNQIETTDLCKIIYTAQQQTEIAGCQAVYNQIMQQGLTQTLYTIFNYAQTLEVKFQNQFRSQAFLDQYLYNDQKMRDLIDIVKSYMRDAFTFVAAEVTDSVNAYFDSLATYYSVIYACYMSLSLILCLVFGLFVFKKLREQIITSAHILSIMPLEELDQRDRQKIESFLNS